MLNMTSLGWLNQPLAHHISHPRIRILCPVAIAGSTYLGWKICSSCHAGVIELNSAKRQMPWSPCERLKGPDLLEILNRLSLSDYLHPVATWPALVGLAGMGSTLLQIFCREFYRLHDGLDNSPLWEGHLSHSEPNSPLLSHNQEITSSDNSKLLNVNPGAPGSKNAVSDEQENTASSSDFILQFSNDEANRMASLIWRNECGCTRDGLTMWNPGEEFPSLGIGHFIWYTKAHKGPYDETFPDLVTFLSQQPGVALPRWLAKNPRQACPWRSKAKFDSAKGSRQMRELRQLLANTVSLQCRFMALRLQKSLPKMLESVPVEAQETIRRNFYRVAGEPMGLFCLMDYVNFKGDGTKETERYRGEGWGLLQVLQGMEEDECSGLPTNKESFVCASKKALERRVKNSSPARQEYKWLPGWNNRLESYVFTK